MRFEDGGFSDYVMSEIYPVPGLHDWPGHGRDCSDWVWKDFEYLLPRIIHCNNQPYLEWRDEPIVLVLAPTKYVGLG